MSEELTETVERTETDAALEAGRQLGTFAASVRQAEDVSFVVVPKDYVVADLTKSVKEERATPDRIRTAPTLKDVGSFIAYVNRFALPGTLLFASRDENKVIARIDYHEPGTPSWSTHTATLALVVSEEWRAWRSHNSQAMDQAEFANFLEERALDVRNPTAAALQEIVSNLELHRDVNFRSVVNLQDGTRRFRYEENEQGTEGQITVPSRLTLGLRFYEGMDAWEVSARLRYRMERGKLTFAYLIDRPERIAEEAFQLVCSQIGDATGKPVLIGTP